ncbi:MAG: hypothetical protein A2252_06520 [Elusimicrobia bacterium RIFOXYA2_FULL_39_19]|nr:MAG: hypothetical protein A2252_06520 [Elusimicrobia bacterium RIFOXYA2_FULL_39_19]
MNKTILTLTCCLAVILFLNSASSFGQGINAGVEIDPSGFGSKSDKDEKKVEKPDALADRIAVRFAKESKEIQEQKKKGYGYNELIKLLLIAQKADVKFETIIELRNKKTKIADIAKKYNLNYKEIYMESGKIKSELVFDPSEYLKPALASNTTDSQTINTQGETKPK